MSIGLVVDYAAHIVHFYLFQNPDLEVKNAGKARGVREGTGSGAGTRKSMAIKNGSTGAAPKGRDTVLQRTELKKNSSGGCMAGVFRFNSPLASPSGSALGRHRPD